LLCLRSVRHYPFAGLARPDETVRGSAHSIRPHCAHWRTAAVVAFLLALGSAATVFAGAAAEPPRTIDVSHFRVAPSGAFLLSDSALPLGHLDLAVALYADYARGGVLVAVDRMGTGLPDDPVSARFGLQLAAALGLMDHAEIGVNFLGIPYQSGDLELFGDAGAPRSLVLGDMRVRAKVNPYPQAEGVTFALAAEVGLPTGNDHAFTGDRSASFTPWLLVDLHTGRFAATLNAGYTIRKRTEVADLVVDDEVRLGLGLRFDLVPRRLSLLVDSYARVGAAARTLGPEEVPAELDGAVRFTAGSWQITAGGGAGLGTGYGAPGMRFFVGGGRAPAESDDPDRDGLRGDADRCPFDPEDFDGFQDEDGCSEDDNDFDGVRDKADRCPLDPEDRDGHDDADGCPDLDNDGDGLADLADRCPNAAEDKDGFQDEDGCPDDDNDTDGLLDRADKCPLDAEDKDGFEDDDGCPDLDNDADGIADLKDRCPLAAEDKDGFEDDDGCPDPDNDGDGLADAVDKCPVKPETWNGFEDEDGCPDKGKVLVEVKAEKVEIKDKIFFDFNKATIKKKSFKLLDAVAFALRAHVELRKVRIEGHTDEVGTRDYNLKLSDDRARAVMDYLVARGVEAARLEAAGFGFDKPLSPGKSKKDRELNRRVEFVIVDRAGEGGM
jgi:outer membrane protein OmpA-like peptidoglycan-associated protein